MSKEYTQNNDSKFDIQLNSALKAENKLGEILTGSKIELKTENWLWEKTGNMCIEFECNGKPSGISTTEADYWTHELRRDDDTLVYITFPIDVLKRVCMDAIEKGMWQDNAGDDKKSKVILLPLEKLLAFMI